MSAPAKTQALEALVEAHARELHLPPIRERFRALAAEDTREQQAPLAYLAALLEAEVQERAERRERRLRIVKRLDEFRFERFSPLWCEECCQHWRLPSSTSATASLERVPPRGRARRGQLVRLPVLLLV